MAPASTAQVSQVDAIAKKNLYFGDKKLCDLMSWIFGRIAGFRSRHCKMDSGYNNSDVSKESTFATSSQAERSENGPVLGLQVAAELSTLFLIPRQLFAFVNGCYQNSTLITESCHEGCNHTIPNNIMYNRIPKAQQSTEKS
jgi:hypothetical protein